VSTGRADEAAYFAKGCELLRDADRLVRRLAVQQWDRDRHVLRVAFLLEALFDADDQVRAAAATAIGRSGDGSVMIALMKRAEDEDNAEVRKALIEAAGRLLATADEELRVEAVAALAKSRTPDAVELLEDIWKDPAREVRKTAAQLLYKLGDKPAVHRNYRELARDDDEFIRVLAALRWARVGSHEALECLVEHLSSDNSWDREHALAELEERTGDSFGYNYRSKPTSRRNREAISKFEEWFDEHPDSQ
jgi:HEAT repeat protein